MQQVRVIEETCGNDFEKMTNGMISDGYTIRSTCISRPWAGTEDEGVVYRAILVKENA